MMGGGGFWHFSRFVCFCKSGGLETLKCNFTFWRPPKKRTVIKTGSFHCYIDSYGVDINLMCVLHPNLHLYLFERLMCLLKIFTWTKPKPWPLAFLWMTNYDEWWGMIMNHLNHLRLPFQRSLEAPPTLPLRLTSLRWVGTCQKSWLGTHSPGLFGWNCPHFFQQNPTQDPGNLFNQSRAFGSGSS